MKVYVLILSHKHGIDTVPCATQDRAEAELEAYCREWWEEQYLGDLPAPGTGDRWEIIDRYYEFTEDEWAEIKEQTLLGADEERTA